MKGQIGERRLFVAEDAGRSVLFVWYDGRWVQTKLSCRHTNFLNVMSTIYRPTAK